MINIIEEANHCLLCASAPCNKACPYDTHPARGIRAVRFDDETNAGLYLTSKCLDCDAPCEKACIHPDRPIRIQEIARDVFPKHKKIEKLPDLGIDFCGVHCENPFFLASSAICTNYEMVARAFDMGWGGVVFKTVTTMKIEEVSPRFDAISKDGLPFVGFRNMEQLSENPLDVNLDIIHRLKENYPTKVVIASIMGQTEQEWIEIARKVEAAGADMIELNFSCPQMKLAGVGSDIGQSDEAVQFYTSYVRSAVKIPIIAKMTPNVTHINRPATAAFFAGADAIAAINTIKSVTMNQTSLVNGRRTISGYSGKAVKPIAQRCILEIANNSIWNKVNRKLQISGIGGIETWRDALEYIQLGCHNVQVCTSVMQYGYRVIEDLILGLQTYMAQNNISRLEDLVGSEIKSFCTPADLDRATKIYPVFNSDKCIHCGRCFISCEDAGHQAITFDKNTRTPKLNGQKCAGCLLCKLICPASAISISKRVNIRR